MFKFAIKNRFSGSVQFIAELDKDTGRTKLNLGLAVRWGFNNNKNLEGADLTGADLTGAVLTGADLRDADLTGADLTGAVLRDAVLRDAVLTGADLTGADLTGAVLRDADLKIPTIKNIHQTIYQAASQEGALNMKDWHTCDTTHCRAGWVVTLAGEAGEKLEQETSTATAAYLIYRKSDPNTSFAINFYDTDKAALFEMKRLAEEENVA